CNSTYGFTGVGSKTGKMTMLYLAAAVTKIGQEMVQMASDFCTDNLYTKTVYGDTDSVMVTPRCYEYRDVVKRTKVIDSKSYKNEDVTQKESSIISEDGILYIYVSNDKLERWFEVREFIEYANVRFTEIFKHPSRMEFEELSAFFSSGIKKCYIKAFIINYDIKYISDNMRIMFEDDGLVSIDKRYAKLSGVISKKRDTSKWRSEKFNHI